MWLPSQQGREGPLGCAVVGHYFYCCVLFAFVATHPCSRPKLCVSPHARPCFVHNLCLAFPVIAMLRRAHSRVLAEDGNHV